MQFRRRKKMKQARKKLMAALLVLALILCGKAWANPVKAQAAKKPVFLSKTKIALERGKSKTLRVKKSGKVRIKKKTFKSSDKKVATVTRRGKITAKRAGKATVKVTVKYAKGKKRMKKILTCKVTVAKENRKTQPSATPMPEKSPVPTPGKSPAPTPEGSPALTPEESPAPTFEESPDLTISSASELDQFAQNVNGGNDYSGKLIQLTQDIQYDGVTVNNFEPIAYGEKTDFQGTFDGCGHIISGVDVTDASGVCAAVGLFGYIGKNGVVKNVTVSDSAFMGRNERVACIAGESGGLINNCHNRGTSARSGIVHINRGTVINCSSTGELNSHSDPMGGISSTNEEGARILNSCNMGNIYNTAEYSSVMIGGVAGENSGTVQNCYNTGVINHIGKNVLGERCGGITEYNYKSAIVANCYSSIESAGTNFGVMKGVEKNCKALPADDMRTEAFVKDLNGNCGSNAEWLNWGIETDGSILYPIPYTGYGTQRKEMR